MSKIFFTVGSSMDGFIAGLNGGPKNPLGDGGTAIHKWLYQQKAFHELLELGKGGETGKDNAISLNLTNIVCKMKSWLLQLNVSFYSTMHQ